MEKMEEKQKNGEWKQVIEDGIFGRVREEKKIDKRRWWTVFWYSSDEAHIKFFRVTTTYFLFFK